MTGTTPLLITLFAAVVGAVITLFIARRAGYGPLLGILLGAPAGALGAQIFMLPLNYCTFEPERTPVDAATGIFLVLLGVAIAIVPLRWVLVNWRLRRSGAFTGGQTSMGIFQGTFTPYLLLSPTLLILALFLYYPFLDTFRLSTLLAGRGPRSRFVCVDNFTDLLTDNSYHFSILVTVIIAVAIVVLGMSLSLLIATLAYQPIRGASIYRTLLIWPYAISPVVAGVIFGLMFDPASGVINYFLDNLFGVKPPWLRDGNLAIMAVILTSIWKTMGFNILFYIAGLQNIPKDLLEAAGVDGANVVQRFLRITVPLLSPITFFLIVTNLTYAFFEIFGTIDYLTAGGPLNATSTMIYRVYEQQNETLGLGRAAAESLILFLLVVGITLVQFRTQDRRVNYGA